MDLMKCYCGGRSKITKGGGEDFWHISCEECGHHHQNYGYNTVVNDWNNDIKWCIERKMPISQFRYLTAIMNDR